MPAVPRPGIGRPGATAPQPASRETAVTDPLVATFGDNAEWHNKAGGDVLHGHEAIREFYVALFRGFPDFDIEVRLKHVAAEAIIVETEITGTHLGEFMGVQATGRSIRVPLCAIFTFTDNDLVKAERVYYDQLSLLSQLGVITLP